MSVIDMVKRRDVIDPTDILEHCVAEECITLFNCNGTYRNTTKIQLTHCLQFNTVQVLYIRMAVPATNDISPESDKKFT